jgi:hypothetical protein
VRLGEVLWNALKIRGFRFWIFAAGENYALGSRKRLPEEEKIEPEDRREGG